MFVSKRCSCNSIFFFLSLRPACVNNQPDRRGALGEWLAKSCSETSGSGGFGDVAEVCWWGECVKLTFTSKRNLRL